MLQTRKEQHDCLNTPLNQNGKPMNLFYEDYPTAIEVEGEEIPILTDFRSYVQLADMLKDADITSIEKFQLIKQYFKEEPADFKKAIDALMDFVTMAKLPRCGAGKEGNDDDNKDDIPKKEVYSFSIDYPFIFSAFLREYGINIRTIPYMHWWEYCLLFEGLSEESEIKQRIMYRNTDLNEIKDKDERKRVEKIQRLIRLPGNDLSDYNIGDAFGW